MHEYISTKIYEAIQKAERIMIIPHQDPDGDALGSASAFAYLLKRMNKSFTLFCSTQVTDKVTSLPHIVKIETDKSAWGNYDFDLVIILDTGDLRRSGIGEHLKKLNEATIINIDHHPTNTNFGNLNLVVPQASSTAEIVYYFFKHNNLIIDKKIAVSLLTGLITDTDNFSNGATNQASLKIASELIHYGANFNMIKSLFLKNKSITTLKLWGVALSKLTKHDKHDFVHTNITRADLAETEAAEEETDGIANFLNNVGEGSAAILLKETADGKIKTSLRTTKENFDVGALAKALGGGGHKKASGFTMEGTVESVLVRIGEEVEKMNQTV